MSLPTPPRRTRRALAIAAVAVATTAVLSSCALIGGGGDGAQGVESGDEASLAAIESGLDEAGEPERGGQLVYGLEAEVSDKGYCLPEAELAISGMQVAK